MKNDTPSGSAIAITLDTTHSLSIRLDNQLWGYAIWVGRWYVVYNWESEITGSLHSPKTADTAEDVQRIVREWIQENYSRGFMYQVYDFLTGEIIDEFSVLREAEKEARHLNEVHNPPSYAVKKTD